MLYPTRIDVDADDDAAISISSGSRLNEKITLEDLKKIAAAAAATAS